MAYDEALATRTRSIVADLAPAFAEKRMFGGLAFLVGGHMAVSASGEGGLLVRCDPEATASMLARPGASPMVMRGREMDGWLRVDDAALGDGADEALAGWVRVGVEYAAGLPPRE